MQKQTTHISFEPCDMKDYAYAVSAKLNRIIKGKAEPVYERAGIWDIKIVFDNFSIGYRGQLSKYFYYKFVPELAASLIKESINKELAMTIFKSDSEIADDMFKKED